MSMLVYVFPLLYQIQSDPTKMIFEENTISIFKHRHKTTHQYNSMGIFSIQLTLLCMSR